MEFSVLLVVGFLAKVCTESTHFCSSIKEEVMQTDDSCASFLKFVKAGFIINPVLSNLGNLTEEELENKLYNWALHEKSSSPNCTYEVKIQKQVFACCSGWEGWNCTLPICDLTCQNGGFCQEPGRCSCPPGFAGPGCQDDTHGAGDKKVPGDRMKNYWFAIPAGACGVGLVTFIACYLKCKKNGMESLPLKK